MFNQPKSLFGGSSFSGTGSTFGQIGTSTFGFGQPQPQTSAPGTNVFSNTFGASGAPAAAPGVFGQPAASASGNTLFGASTTQPAAQGTGLFGQKAAGGGFNFGGAPATGTPVLGSGIFGGTTASAAAPASSGSLFGASATPASSGSNLFGSGVFGAGVTTPASGAAAGTGTARKFVPPVSTDTVPRGGGQNQTVNTKHQCITAMKDYESKSLEELRIEDYMANRKGPQTAAPATGIFGVTPLAPTVAPGAFGGFGAFGANANTAAQKPLFGATQPASGVTPFGTTPATGTGTSLFGGAATNKPLFGATSAAPTFGMPAASSTATPSGFAFGAQPAASATSTGSLFASKPLFGATGITPASSAPLGFGGFSAAAASQTTGAAPLGSTFGQPAGSGLFGVAKPAAAAPGGFTFGGTSGLGAAGTTAAPAPFSFGVAKPAFGATGSGTGLFGGAAAPAVGSGLFGASCNAATATKPLFGGVVATSNPLGVFGQSSGGGLGSLGGGGILPAFGMASMVPPVGGAAQPAPGFSANPEEAILQQARVQQQVLQLVSSIPYGSSALFKQQSTSTSGTMGHGSPATSLQLLPTNPEAQLKLRVTSEQRSTPKPQPAAINSSTTDVGRRALFDCLDETEDSPATTAASRGISRLGIGGRGSATPGDFFVRRTAWKELVIPASLRTSLDSRSNFDTGVSHQRRHSAEENRSLDVAHDTQTSTVSTTTTATTTTTTTTTTAVNTTSMKELSQTSDGSKIESETNLKQRTPVSAAVASNETSPNQNEQEVLSPVRAELSSLHWNSDTTLAEVSVLQTPSASIYPAGIVLSKAGYYTIPPLEEIQVDDEGRCIVHDFIVGRQGFGRVLFPGTTNIAGVNFDSVVHIRRKEIMVYPDDETKPPVGQGLNKRAEVTLDAVWPTDKATRQAIREPARLAQLRFAEKLERATEKLGARFVDYQSSSGSWVFEVRHFSRYRFEDSDEDDAEQEDYNAMDNYMQQQHELQPPVDVAEKLDVSEIHLKHFSADESLRATEEVDLDAQLEIQPEVGDPEVNDTMDETEPLSFGCARGFGVPPSTLQLMKAAVLEEDEEAVEEQHKQPAARRFIKRPKSQHFAGQLFTPKTTTGAASPRRRTPAFLSPMKFRPFELGTPNQPLVASGLTAEPAKVRLPEHCKQLPVNGWNVSEHGDLITDAALFRGRAARMSWAAGQLLLTCHGNKVYLTALRSPPQLQQDQMVLVEQNLLNAALDSSISGQDVNVSSNCNSSSIVCWLPRPGREPLRSLLYQLEQDTAATSTTLSEPLRNLQRALMLCQALWGDLPVEEEPPAGTYELYQERKEALSAWLRQELGTNPVAHVNDPVLQALLSGQVAAAVTAAQTSHQPRLALLLSQLGGSDSVRRMVGRQLDDWAQVNADQYVDPNLLRLYALLAGRRIWQGSSGQTVNCCAGLDWKHAFSVHLWYLCPLEADLSEVLAAYQEAVELGETVPPDPPHSCGTQDLLYQLVTLHVDRSRRLEWVLAPAGSSADPLEMRTSWHVWRVLHALGFQDNKDGGHCERLHVDYAAQLEAAGLWEWAAFVLLHLRRPEQRATAVRALLVRRMRRGGDDAAHFLTARLGMPRAWLEEAAALWARHSWAPLAETRAWLAAGHWEAAHLLIVHRLAPQWLLNRNHFKTLRTLLRQLQRGGAGAGGQPVRGWASGGQLLLDYLFLEGRLAALRRGELVNLEELRLLLSDMCQRIATMPSDTPKLRLCRTELSHLCSRILQVIVNEQSTELSSQQAEQQTLLLSRLHLPEDLLLQEARNLASAFLFAPHHH